MQKRRSLKCDVEQSIIIAVNQSLPSIIDRTLTMYTVSSVPAVLYAGTSDIQMK